MLRFAVAAALLAPTSARSTYPRRRGRTRCARRQRRAGRPSDRPRATGLLLLPLPVAVVMLALRGHLRDRLCARALRSRGCAGVRSRGGLGCGASRASGERISTPLLVPPQSRLCRNSSSLPRTTATWLARSARRPPPARSVHTRGPNRRGAHPDCDFAFDPTHAHLLAPAGLFTLLLSTVVVTGYDARYLLVEVPSLLSPRATGAASTAEAVPRTGTMVAGTPSFPVRE